MKAVYLNSVNKFYLKANTMFVLQEPGNKSQSLSNSNLASISSKIHTGFVQYNFRCKASTWDSIPVHNKVCACASLHNTYGLNT